jgi:O-antigen ligase
MEILYYFFVLVNPFLPMSMLMVVPLQVFFGGLFLVWLLFRLQVSGRRPHYNLQHLFCFLFAWVLLADLINLARLGTWQELRHLAGRLTFFVFILTTYAVVRDRQRYLRVLRLLMVSVLTLSICTIVCALFKINPLGAHASLNPREFWGAAMPFERYIGVPMSYGEYGLVINSVLPLFWVSVWQKNFLLKRSWALLGLAVLLLAVFITQSRNSWLATFLVITFLTGIMILRPANLFLKSIAVLLGLLGLLVAVGWLTHELHFMFAGFAEGRQIHTFARRLQVDSLAFTLFLNNWFFGAGHQELVQQLDKIFNLPLVVHNGYLEQLASTGLFGFIPFMGLLLLSFFVLLRLSHTGFFEWRLLALCLAGSFLANISLLMAYKGFFSETFAIEYGLMLSLVELSKQKEVKVLAHETAAKNLPYYHHLVRAGRQQPSHAYHSPGIALPGL